MKDWFNYKRILTPMFCLMLALPFTATAATDMETQVDSLNVGISDINLEQKEGVETLYVRLKKAARKICGDKYTHVTGSRTDAFKIKRQHKKCMSEALASAVNKINNPNLTALHAK